MSRTLEPPLAKGNCDEGDMTKFPNLAKLLNWGVLTKSVCQPLDLTNASNAFDVSAMKTILIDDDLHSFLLRNTKEIGEDASSIIRRLLNLPKIADTNHGNGNSTT